MNDNKFYIGKDYDIDDINNKLNEIGPTLQIYPDQTIDQTINMSIIEILMDDHMLQYKYLLNRIFHLKTKANYLIITLFNKVKLKFYF